MSRWIWLCVAVGVMAAGCSVDIHALTTPPPTKVADVDTFDHKITLSQGVAVAVECTDTCDGTCRDVSLVPSDETLIEIMPAFRGTQGGTAAVNDANAVFVLVGMKPGTTDLKVQSACTDESYRLTVVE